MTSAYCRKECHNGGECVRHDQCRCTRGYTGRFCQQRETRSRFSPVYSYTSFRFLSLYTTCLSGLNGVHFALLLPFTYSTFEFCSLVYRFCKLYISAYSFFSLFCFCFCLLIISHLSTDLTCFNIRVVFNFTLFSPHLPHSFTTPWNSVCGPFVDGPSDY